MCSRLDEMLTLFRKTPPPRLPSRQYEESTFWKEIREERALERAVQAEKNAYFKWLLADADRTGCYKEFWKAMRNEEHSG